MLQNLREKTGRVGGSIAQRLDFTLAVTRLDEASGVRTSEGRACWMFMGRSQRGQTEVV